MHTPTDYFKGTVMQPEKISTLKNSYQDYEELGKQHRKLSSRISQLQEAMRFSRQRGAFQELQRQMKEVKDLVKQREELDGMMAVADLARKKDDDHRLAVKQEVSYSEQLNSVGERISEFESKLMSYSESGPSEFDFARCVRPDGSSYGTRGECVAPNRREDVPAGKGGMSTAQRAAYAAGGGNAAAMRGKSIAEVQAQGQRNLQRLDQGQGRSGMARSAADATRSGKPLTPAELAAYKAGGGDAAARRNKGGVDEAIDQGRRNLQRLDQGQGRSGMARSAADATRSGKPLTPKRREDVPAGKGGMSTAQRAAYAAGGGNAAAMRGKSIAEVQAQGQRNLQRLDQGQGRTAGNFTEDNSHSLDFARCQRPDGTFYGTRGKCKKGMNVGAAPEKQAAEGAPKGMRRKSVSEQRAMLKQVLVARRQAERNELSARRARAAVEKETRGDNSLDARRKRAAAQKSHEKAQALAERAAVASDRAFIALSRAVQREERAKMSPKRRRAERALDSEVKLRG